MAKTYLIVIKYTFYVAMIFSAGLVIERLADTKRMWKVDPIVADDLVYNGSFSVKSRSLHKILDKRYLECLTKPTKPFCLLSANKRLEVFRSKREKPPNVEEIESRLHNITSHFPSNRRRIHTVLVEFTKVMRAYRINIILIEPSMLFCLLSSKEKINMLTKGFNPGRLLGSRNIVNVGVLDASSKILESKNVTNEMISTGFKIRKFRKWIGDGAQEYETVHYFFSMEDVAIHVIVFYTINDYLWHAGLDSTAIDLDGLLFVHEEMYEIFTPIPLNLAGTSISRLFIPHDIRQFMREIEISKVAECRTNTSGVRNVENPNLTREQMITRIIIALKELKAIFEPYIAFVWLWSESLLGWFTECNAFHFSTTLNLALPFKYNQQLNLAEILAENEYLRVENTIESKYGYKLDCHGLLVNIYFIYEDDGFVWYKYSNGENHKYKCPLFTLCSTELYDMKVQVPCDSSVVLEVEFAGNGTMNFPPT